MARKPAWSAAKAQRILAAQEKFAREQAWLVRAQENDGECHICYALGIDVIVERQNVGV